MRAKLLSVVWLDGFEMKLTLSFAPKYDRFVGFVDSGERCSYACIAFRTERQS